MNYRKLAKQSIIISLGLMISGFGTSLLYKSTLGTNAMATLSDGLANILNIQYETANTLVNVAMFIPSLSFSKNKMGIGTILMIFTMGLYINFWSQAIAGLPEPSSLFSKVIVNLIGINLMSIGLSIYIKEDAGLGPLEIITDLIRNRLNWSYGKSRLLIEGSILLLGILMGGVFGLGTVICVVSVGLFIEFYIRVFNKVFPN